MAENFEEVKIPVPWGHVAAKWWGPRNMQPMIAIHGWGDNAGTFDTLAPLLAAKNIGTICIDLPGHGLSSWYPPGMVYSIWGFTMLLRRIVKYYGWQKVTLLGHSVGGNIIFKYASCFPNDVKKSISFEISSPFMKSPVEALIKMDVSMDECLKVEELTQRPTWLRYETIVNMLDIMYKGSLPRDKIEIMLKRGLKSEIGDRHQLNMDERLRYVTYCPTSNELILFLAERIICDVMYVKAKQGLLVQKHEYYDSVIQKMTKPKVKKTYVVAGTHHVHLNNPESIVDYVIDFLETSH